jgi:outer membrane protein assembly factor BamB
MPKRQKIVQQDVDTTVTPFVVRDIRRFSDNHFAIDFKACVDASPLVHGTDVYGACQGGVIQRIANHNVVACHQLTGWKIQAGMVIVKDSLIVCGYSNDSDNGIVVALTLDVNTLKWTRHVQGQIKSTPIVRRDQLWVVAGAMLIMLDTVDGNEISSLQLPSKTESRPVVCPGLSCVVYGFTNWDAGLGIANDKGTSITTVHAENVSPVYADLLQLDSNRVAVCDICGVIHDFNIDSLEIKSTRVASQPIFSGPIQVDDSVIFGCHDGIVRCVQSSNFSEQLWEYDARSVVYSSPLALSGDCFVVCTTAGDIIQVRQGKEEWRMTVPGEIWSDPIMIGVDGNIAVGARDSRVHIIRLKKDHI